MNNPAVNINIQHPLSSSPNHHLVIICARAFGRETCNYARDAGWTVKGFLDDKADALDGFSDYPPILGSAESYTPATDDVFVCAVGDSKYREKYASFLAAQGVTFVNIKNNH